LHLPAYLDLYQSQDVYWQNRKKYHLIHYGRGPHRSKTAKMATKCNLMHHALPNRFLQCWLKWPPPLLKISLTYWLGGQLHLYTLPHFDQDMQNMPLPLTIVRCMLDYHFTKFNGYLMFCIPSNYLITFRRNIKVLRWNPTIGQSRCNCS